MNRYLVAALLALVLLPSLARAQQLEGPPLPSAMDLRKVPVGSWAEYKIVVGTMPAMKTRMVLVGRAKSTVTLEMVVEGGMAAAAGGQMVLQTVVDPDSSKAESVKKLVMQVGPNDPMEMPAEAMQRKQFQKPNPKAWVKDESVTVAAGTFKTKHYRDKTAKGDPLEFWTSQEVPPFGLVKVAGVQNAGAAGAPGAQGPVTFELIAHGKDAKAVIVKTPRPFDQQAFMEQLTKGAQPPVKP